MGKILGLGITHYPNLTVQGPMTLRTKQRLADPTLPDVFRDPENWPEPTRLQWGTDEGLAHSDEHRAAMVEQFRHARAVLDEFQPDLCVIWGDDQYETYREDCVPAFCVMAYDEVTVQPFLHNARGKNSWGSRSTSLEEVEDRGHHELLNWFCLAGAMAELGRKPDEAVFLESWITNSNKTFAVFRP